LEADLAARDKFPIVATEGHLPELLGRALVNRLREQRQATAHDRADEIGVVVDADRELATLDDGEGGAHAGGTLDCGGEGSTMDDSPGRVMVRPHIDRSHHACRPDRVELHPQCF